MTKSHKSSLVGHELTRVRLKLATALPFMQYILYMYFEKLVTFAILG